MSCSRGISEAVTALARRRAAGVFAALAATAVGLAATAALAATLLSAFWGWPLAAAAAAALGAGAFFVTARSFGLALVARARLAAVLKEAEVRVPALRRRLAPAYSLVRAGAGGASPALTAAFVRRVEESLPTRLAAPLPGRFRLAPAALFATALAAWLAVALAAPGFLASRWAALAAAASSGDGIIAEVVPGDARVGANRPFAVSARLTREVGGDVVAVVERGGGEAQVLLAPAGAHTFAASFNAGAEDFRYYVTAGGERSRRYDVAVMPPPALGKLNVTVTPPAYAGLGPRALAPGEGDITALAGARVDVEVKASGAQGVELVFDAARPVPLKREGDSYAGTFVVAKRGVYRAEATSPWGRTATPAFRIVPRADAPPTVTITAPGRDILLADVTPSPRLHFTCADDFGLGDVRVVYYNEVTGQSLDVAVGAGAGRRELEGDCDLVPPGMDLFPGDAVTYYVEAWDNDTVAGPKAGRSPSYRFRLPTGAEMFARINEDMTAGVAELEGLAQELRDFGEKLRREEAADTESGPSRPRLRELAGEQDRLRRELAAAAAKLNEMLAAAEGSALSPELAAKLSEANRLLNEVLDERAKEALRRLGQALREVDPERIKELMAQVRLDQAEMSRQLERVLNVLREAQREELLKNLTAQAEALAVRQKELAARAAAGQPQAEDARQQDLLANEVAAFPEAITKAAASYDEVDAKVAAELRAVAAKLAREKAAEAAKEAAADLAAGDLAAAAAKGKITAAQLRAAAEALGNMSERYRQTRKGALLAELDRALAAVLAASNRTEALAAELAGGDVAAGFAGRQRNLAAAVAALSERAEAAAAKSLFVPPAVADTLAAAGAELAAAADNYELGKPGAASAGAMRALAGLNVAAAALLDTRANVAAAGSSMGLAEMLERMKALTQGQRGVNEQGQSLFSMMPGMTPSRLQQMLEQLAAEQALIRRGLEELSRRGRGSRGNRAADLGGIGRDMEEVEKDLAAGRLDERVIAKQEKLLERMLTATRAMRVQGRSSRRRSTPGKAYATPAVAPLPPRLTAPRREGTPASGPPRQGYVPADLRGALADYYRRLAAGE